MREYVEACATRALDDDRTSDDGHGRVRRRRVGDALLPARALPFDIDEAAAASSGDDPGGGDGVVGGSRSILVGLYVRYVG